MTSIAIVIDEKNIVVSLGMAFEAKGYTVEGYTDPLVALPKLICLPPRLLFLNGRMPGMHGLEFFQRFRQYSRAPVVFLSASADEIRCELEERRTPADGYVELPYTHLQLLDLAAQLLGRRA